MIITDLHLNSSNLDEVSKIIRQAILKAKELGLEHLYVGGDVFDSRKSQPLAVLQCWIDILGFAELKGITLRTIPGNHDKADYTSEESYLDVYEDHPSFELVRSYAKFKVGKYTMHMIPFFEERETYGEYLKKVEFAQKNNILLTHVAVDGVRNNDGSVVEDLIDTNIFKKFDKVFVGHYHDKQQIDNTIFYIGSILQKNYGEDVNKGFTVMYDDGTHELLQSEFKKFETVKIDLDTLDQESLTDLRRQHSDSSNNVRFKFTGTKEKIAALDKSKFDSVGIDVKCEYKDVEVEVSFQEASVFSVFSGFDGEKIKDEWKEFCEKNEDIDKKQGLSYLQKVL